MSRQSLFFGLFMALGLAVLGGYYYSQTRPAAAPAKLAGSGARLEINVAGQANGRIIVQLFEDVAPRNTERLKKLASVGAYDNVVFHRVIDGFMAQTGDVKYGKADRVDPANVGRGGSFMPDLPLEPSKIPFSRGTVGMARASSPDSANSQFFIMFAPASHLNGQYTVVGQVVEGLDVLDAIKRGEGANGQVVGKPDVMTSVRVLE